MTDIQTEDRKPDAEKADADKPNSDYKDDAASFAQSSDVATRGRTGPYAGNSPGENADDLPDPAIAKGNNAGSQEDWQGKPAAKP